MRLPRPSLPRLERPPKPLIFIGTFLWKIREVFIILGAYLAYMFARKVVLGDVADVATANALRVIDFESTLGFFREPQWQAWVIDRIAWLVTTLNWAYIMTFFPIIALTAIIVYLRDRLRYFHYRNILMMSFVVALAVFVFFPLAPPRLMTEHVPFIDTLTVYGPASYASREFAAWYNLYAAMPSLHFGWTILFGILFFFTKGPWYAQVVMKTLGLAYPTVTFFAITITANHYILDAVGGAAVIAMAFLLYIWLRRWRRSSSFLALQIWVKGRIVAPLCARALRLGLPQGP